MRLKILSGAPLSENLDYTDKVLQQGNECEQAVKGFLEGTVGVSSEVAEEEERAVKWRHLQPKDTRLRTGWSQPHLPGDRLNHHGPSASILEGLQNASVLPEDETRLDGTSMSLNAENTSFLEHSLLFHETLPSSQIGIDSHDSDLDKTVSSSSFLSTGSSFESFNTDANQQTRSQRRNEQSLPILQLPARVLVTPLRDLPSARHIKSIGIATPTANLLCAVVDHSEPRVIRTKKSGQRLLLQELSVADDTLPSFRVSFWFRPFDQPSGKHYQQHLELGKTIEKLKLGDIVLLRNIVLSTFNDTLHGQSLRPSINKARTIVEVLKRGDDSFAYGQILPEKANHRFDRVKKWARGHVAASYGAKKGRAASQEEFDSSFRPSKKSRKYDNSLPPDTLEAV